MKPAALQPILDRIPESWGKSINVGPGWHRIIVELDKKLSELDPNYEVHQVKQKFGGLRYYCSLDTNRDALWHILVAEEQAFVTCEECGAAAGRKVVRGWVCTLCGECLKKKSEKKVG